MSIIDTSLLINIVSEGKVVHQNISFITVIEYPMILEYEKFNGKVFYPDEKDFMLALELQMKLRKIGKMKNASDHIIAATCINNKENLMTNDSDFDAIADVSNLNII